MASSVSKTRGERSARAEEVAAAYAAFVRCDRIALNLNEQANLLRAFETQATTADDALSLTIQKLESRVDDAEGAAERARRDVIRVIKTVAAADPGCAPEKFLEPVVSTATREVLREARISVEWFVDALLIDADGPTSLRDELLESLASDGVDAS